MMIVERANISDVDKIINIQNTCYPPHLIENMQIFINILECGYSYIVYCADRC